MAAENGVQVDGLVAKSAEVFDVLREHAVFGGIGAEWLASEQAGFKSVVTAHAVGWLGNQPLVLSYPTCVRLIIDTAVVDGEAKYVSISAYGYPWEHDSIDYESLNRNLQALLSH